MRILTRRTRHSVSGPRNANFRYWFSILGALPSTSVLFRMPTPLRPSSNPSLVVENGRPSPLPPRRVVQPTLILCIYASASFGSGVSACATHPVLSGSAIEKISGSPLKEVVVTNSIPLKDEARRCERIRVLSVAPLIARAIREVFEDGSVTSLFEGRS